MNKKILLGLSLPLLVLLASCALDPSDWYPSGKASLASFYELGEGSTTTCYLTLLVENSGSSTISQSTVSLEVETDARSYYTTLVSTTTILPGGKVYLSGNLSYADAAETSSAARITLVSEFYQ